MTSSNVKATPHRFLFLDALRGLAAVCVMMKHASQGVGAFYFFDHSRLAVDLFFILSGFVVSYAYEQRLLTGQLKYWDYVALRLARLYPMIIFGGVLSVLYLFILKAPGYELVAKSALPQILAMPVFNGAGYDIAPLNPPSWSLFFELFISLVYGFLLVRMRNWQLAALALLSGLGLVVATWFYRSNNLGLLEANFAGGFVRVTFSFVVGMILQRAHTGTMKLPVPNIAVPAWLICVVAFICLVMPYNPLGPALGLFIVLFVNPIIVLYGARVMDLPPAAKPAAEFSGFISYPVYIVHWPIIMTIYALAAQHGFEPKAHKAIVIFGSVIVATLLAAAIGRFYDMPVQRLFKQAIRRSSSRVVGGTAIIATLLIVAVPTVILLLSARPPAAYAATMPGPVCRGTDGYLKDTGVRTFLVRADALDRLKGTAATNPHVRALIAEADQALTRAPTSVMDKTFLPPSGDKRDYVSLDNYSWPIPGKPGVWEWRDGFFNPAYTSGQFDYGRWYQLVNDTETLALAYRITGDDRYAKHAASLMRSWFVDPKTRMYPRMLYSQIIPGDKGQTNGNGTIDGWRLVFLIDAAGLITPSGALSDADQQGLREWVREYLAWMSSSKQGKHEYMAFGNHANYYDVQRIDFALFTGQADLARKLAQMSRRRTVQIDSEGDLPKEIERADKAHYIAFGSHSFATLSSVAACAGVDLWHYQGTLQGNVPSVFTALSGYVDGTRIWPGTRALHEPLPVQATLVMAARAYGNPAYVRDAQRLNVLPPDPDQFGYYRWSYIKYPELDAR